jgi:DNA-binding ferritin-like protein
MSKSQKALAVDRWAEEQVAERPVLILEKQLIDTLELQWHAQQVRIRSNGTTTTKTRLLFDGMASEIQTFIDLIRKRLECWRKEAPHIVENVPGSYWRLFAADSIDPREQFEALLCSYARYARQTWEALTSLRRSGDLESSELLGMISNAIERCLWFLEIYLEGLALNSDGSRLPEWSASLS